MEINRQQMETNRHLNQMQVTQNQLCNDVRMLGNRITGLEAHQKASDRAHQMPRRMWGLFQGILNANCKTQEVEVQTINL